MWSIKHTCDSGRNWRYHEEQNNYSKENIKTTASFEITSLFTRL